MRVIDDKIDAVSTYPAIEFNSLKNEAKNSVETSGQTLDPADNNQVGKAISIYCADGDFYTDSGDATAYVLSSANSRQTPISYTVGMLVRFIPANTNTGAATINVATLGVQSIFQSDGTALNAGDLLTNVPIGLVYDGTNFRIETASVQLSLTDPLTLPFSDLTIDGSNILTVTNSTHAIFNNAGATGNLDRIITSGPIPDGYRLLLRLKDASRQVVIRDRNEGGVVSGNIALGRTTTNSGTLVQTMVNVGDEMEFSYNSELALWVETNNNFFTNYGSGLITVQRLTASGTWIRPTGVRNIVVEVQGGGGGGAILDGVVIGAAGGGGGYARKLITNPPASQVYAIGGGGLGFAGAGSGLGGNAASSTFGAIVGSGGSGGNITPNNGGIGGVGQNGDLNIAGERGDTFSLVGPGPQAAIGNGKGGDAVLGFGAKLIGSPANTPGNAVSPGGGGGAGGIFSTPRTSGGNGANGLIIVTEYY